MKNSHYLFLISILVLLNVFVWQEVVCFWQESELKVVFFDIGQGDAIFIVTPGQHQILIDGGRGSLILEKLAGEMPFWDRTIDLIVLTHPHSDHIAGLIEVLKRYKVENILWTGIIYDSSEYKKWVELIQKEGGNIYIAHKGLKIIANPGAVISRALHPLENLEGKGAKKIDNTSIVIRTEFQENSFLFTGDIYKEVEETLFDISSNVLKVAHHGSKHSSHSDFIERVSPEIAVISAGKGNSHGHPHKETLDILEKYDIKIFRTDLSGDIRIFSDGKNLKVESKN